MKIVFIGMALLFAGAAMAQTSVQAGAQTGAPVEPVVPAPVENMAPAPVVELPALVEKDGKWWNGDREATPAEILAWKKAQKPG